MNHWFSQIVPDSPQKILKTKRLLKDLSRALSPDGAAGDN